MKKNLKIMICLFHQPTNPTVRISLVEIEILEESHEISLDKLCCPGIFIPVSPTVGCFFVWFFHVV